MFARNGASLSKYASQIRQCRIAAATEIQLSYSAAGDDERRTTSLKVKYIS